jgi:zinc protease
VRAATGCLIAALALLPAAGRAAAPVVSRHVLGNGLVVLVHEDHSAPVVSTYVFYRTGSRNERRGHTGLAHLFEHMMFNGSRAFGPGSFDDLIEGNGGSTNGYTTRDYTAYLNNAPREALPILLALESDRMAHLLITPDNLRQERGIVMEERRMRIDNDVDGAMWEALYLQAFVESPYRWHPIGFMADLHRIDLASARRFYEQHYAPNQAVLVIAGDVDTAATLDLVRRRFGRLRPVPPPPPPHMDEPVQEGERRVVVRKPAELAEVLAGYHAVGATDADRAALDVADELLAGGRSARLVRRLVHEREVASDVWSNLQWSIAPDLFVIGVKAQAGRTAEDLVRELDAALASVAAEPPDAAEVAAAVRRLRAGWARNLERVSGKANQIGFYEVVFGDYRELGRMPAEWEAVTPAEVQRVIATYLARPRRTLVMLEPQPAGGATP